MTSGLALISIAFATYALATFLGAALPIPVAHARSPPRKIVLLHMYDAVPFFQRLGTLTGHNKRRYAERHGYDFVESSPQAASGLLKKLDCYTHTDLIQEGPDASGNCWGFDTQFDIDHSRAPTFGKIKLALAACEGRNDAWLLWSDADAMVVNQSTPLESIIDDAYDIMLTYDWLMMNAGMLLLKCSEWTKTFLRSVYDARQFDKARALDQSSIQEHLDNLTEVERTEHIKVVPKHAMNVYLEEYRPGDFLVHMAGKLYEATESGLFAIANQLDILSMVDDIEDVKAFFRTPAFLNYYSGVCPVKLGEKQSSCKTGDPRRIFLNESLGSMSYPNRYRHVGLRYYWLGDWKDKYDVEGWNIKKKEFVRMHEVTEASDVQVKGSEARKEAERVLHEELGLDEDEERRTVGDEEGGNVGGNGEGDAAGRQTVGGEVGTQGKRGQADRAALFWFRGLAALGIGAAAVAGLRACGKKKMGSKLL